LSDDPKDFAHSIITTDTTIKLSEKLIDCAAFNQNAQPSSIPKPSSPGVGCKIVGIAKGSGMIHPNMATMLAFVMTDLPLETDILQQCLRQAVDLSINQISVDGDTSTNDMVLLMSSNPTQGSRLTKTALEKTTLLDSFQEALNTVCIDLAKQIVSDGEGASKLLVVEVQSEYPHTYNAKIAKGIVSSNLVKAACFGADPNWGRILSAAGQVAGEIQAALTHSSNNSNGPDFKRASLWLMDEQLLEQGKVLSRDLVVLSNKMKTAKEIKIKLNLLSSKSHAQKESTSAYAWGCDLTYDYVKINAEYTS
jgi:glutamate N-acetyltransferase/amino-acid N-acetyltransferase